MFRASQRIGRDGSVYFPVFPSPSKVAHTPQQARWPHGAYPGCEKQSHAASWLQVIFQNVCRSQHDAGQGIHVVILEVHVDPKTGTQGLVSNPLRGGSTHEGERVQVYLNGASTGPPSRSGYQCGNPHGAVEVLPPPRARAGEISSMKSTSFVSSEVRTPARSPGLSSTGPEVT